MAKKQRWAYWKFLQVENWFLSYFSYWTLSSHLLHFRTEYFFRFGINLDFHLMQIVDVENVSRLFFFFKLSPFSTWEITVLYLTFSRHQLEIWWSQIEFTGDALAEPVNGYLRPLNLQLMSWNCQIQYSYLHSNVIMFIYTQMCIAALLTRWRKR